MEKIDTSFLDTIQEFLTSKKMLPDDFYKTFSASAPLTDHIRGLVFSKLSQTTRWEFIFKKEKQIEELFFHFDKEEINQRDEKYFLNGLINLKVGRFRKNLCFNLHHNIKVVEKGLDLYETAGEEYLHYLLKNLEGFGLPLIFEYLHYAGVDRIKPDVHVKRILSRYFYGNDDSKQFSDNGVFEWGKKVRSQGKYNLTQIDILLWRFCSKDNAEICEKKPKCFLCPLSKKCEFGRIYENK